VITGKVIAAPLVVAVRVPSNAAPRANAISAVSLGVLIIGIGSAPIVAA
jgi:hypothetical protein